MCWHQHAVSNLLFRPDAVISRIRQSLHFLTTSARLPTAGCQTQ
jgi:hypothetical protein